VHKRLVSTCAFLGLFTLCVASPCAAAAEEGPHKIALFPFETISASTEETIELREAVQEGLSAELQNTQDFVVIDKKMIQEAISGKHLDDALALEVGRQTGAAYSATGSITSFGQQISVDVRLLEVSTGRALSGVYVQGPGRESLGAILNQLKQDILLRIATPAQKIVRVDFTGNRRIEGNAIRQVLKSAPDNVFSEADLSTDIRAIFRMGYFDDVTANVSDTPEGKVITFAVAEKPMVTGIRVQGNKALKREEIESAMSTRTRQPVNPERLKTDMLTIKELYDSKGYYNAEISYGLEKDGERDVQVVVSVVENTRLYIRRILFEGNRAFTSRELKNMMATNEWGILHFITDSGLLKNEQIRQDVERLKAFYMNNGFINAQIEEPEVTIEQDGLTVKVIVSEGRQFRVGKVEILGDEIAVPRSELMARLQIGKKDFYDRESVIKDMDMLALACNDEGYANAEVIPRTEPHEGSLTIDVTYLIIKQRLTYFNQINIFGNTRTRDKVIRRGLAMAEGDLYSRTKLKNSYMALSRLRYFEEIEFQTEKGPDESLTDVNIRVKEKATGMFSFGAGYSALDHAIISASISQQNLFGRGQSLDLRASIGGRTQLYDISFTEPWLFDIPLWSKFGLWNLYRIYDTYKLDSKGFSATFGYPIWGAHWVGYLGYRLSTDDVKEVLDSASYYIKKQTGQRTTSGVNLSVVRDTTDDNVFPSQGSRNSVAVEYTGGPFMGDVSFTRYGFSSAWFFPLVWENVFSIRGRIGYLVGNEGKEVPIYERYYLGGISSLRGLRQVGPKDPATGDVIGGLTMLNFNVDYIFPLFKDIGMKGVVFFDIGNTWESGYHLEDMRKTAGVGIRWYSPIGPLRVEWGYVLDRKENEPASRWEFTIGMFM